MDDEFKLCWKNFQDNIASGFQNLYDRGDLVDVTLACDGKLLQAHKIVLAICSPYFQEIFTTNPCQHPIIILKDVSFNIMCELLEFMYQGVVNVKHTELQSFMKIGQLLQIKGLATNANSPPVSEKSTGHGTHDNDEPNSSSNSSQNHNSSTNNNNNNSNSNITNSKSETDQIDAKGSSTQSHSRTPSASPSGCRAEGNPPFTQSKRSAPADFNSESLSIYSRKQLRRSLTGEHSVGGSDVIDGAGDNGSIENTLNSEEFFMPPIPHISMVEPRYELASLKREGEAHQSGSIAAGTSSTSAAMSTAVGALRNPFGPAFNLDYNNFYKAGNNSGPSSSNLPGSGNSGLSSSGNSSSSNLGPTTEYPNELYMPSDYSKNFANHMDIPSNGSNMVMLSTTSLLHGNCVFNRNNTVATQQGMKTYWLCKSYRISMCRARCITHLGRIISATGVHNHIPHMRGGNNNSGSGASGNSGSSVTVTPNPNPGPVSYSVSDGNHMTTTSVAGSGMDISHGSVVRLGGNTYGNQASAMSVGHHHHHQHHHQQQQQQVTQPLPNLLVQHHNSSQGILDQHALGSGPPATAPPPPPPAPSGSNSVIQNIMHNPNLMHLPMHQPLAQHPQHSPQPTHHLELGTGSTLLPLSPPHMQSSPQSNRSNHSLHTAASPQGMKSPPPQQHPSASHEADQQQQQRVDLSQGAAGSAESAQVIDSITISPGIAPGEHWFQGKLEFMLSQRGKPLLVHDGHTFGIQYVRKDKKYWQCNLSRKFNCKARVTTTDTGEIIVTNNEHCHTEIRQHLRKDYQRNKVMMNALINLSTNRLAEMRRHNLAGLSALSPMTMVPSGLTQSSPIIDEVVQNLHEIAKASAEASQQHHSLKYENEEPLDCGIRNATALEDMARSFMSNNKQNIDNDNIGNNITKEPDWKCKNEGTDIH